MTGGSERPAVVFTWQIDENKNLTLSGFNGFFYLISSPNSSSDVKKLEIR